MRRRESVEGNNNQLPVFIGGLYLRGVSSIFYCTLFQAYMQLSANIYPVPGFIYLFISHQIV